MYENHKLAPAHLTPEFAQFRRVELQVSDVGSNADPGGAHAEGAIELLNHFSAIRARQYGDEAQTRGMSPADGGEPVVDEARCRRVARACPTDIQSADGEDSRADAGVVHRFETTLQVSLIFRHRHHMTTTVKE